MSILIDSGTRVLVQGITGHDGSFHAGSMLAYGTKIVSGVTPGRGGQVINGVPVFNTVKEACEQTEVDCSIIFVPARFASGAVREAADAGIELIVCITEGIPVIEMLNNYYYIRERGSRLIGPNCPGLLSAGGIEMVYIRGDSTATYGPMLQVIGTVAKSGVKFGLVGEPWRGN